MDTPAPKSHSFRNISIVALTLSFVAAFGVWLYSLEAHTDRQRASLPKNFLKYVLVAPTKLAAGLVDETGDLVASPPKDAKEQIDPDRLVFAVLGVDDERERNRFKELAAHLAKETGKQVDVKVWHDTVPDQMIALRKGTLHLAVMSTGSVSTAVNDGGFVPFCVMADSSGKYGYNMEIVVPTASPIKTPADLKGSKISLASPHSHSGFKAPLVILWRDFNLEPGLDYDASIEGEQEAVLAGLAKGQFKAGAVASDLRKRMIASGEIDEKAVRTIYTSATFPPQCFGHAHQLKPELAAKIKSAFFSFPWEGSDLAKSFAAAGQTKFVPISYKTDWEPIRQMEAEASRFVQKAAETK